MPSKKRTGNLTVCLRCGNTRTHCAKGMCQSCYSNTLPKKVGTCIVCKKEKPLYAKGKCNHCYSKPYMAAYFKKHPDKGWASEDRMFFRHWTGDYFNAGIGLSKDRDNKDSWHGKRDLKKVQELRNSSVGKSFADIILTFPEPTQKALIMDGIFLKKREKELETTPSLTHLKSLTSNVKMKTRRFQELER